MPSPEHFETKGRSHLHVFVEMDWLVVDVVPHEEVIDAGQEGHLRQGEDVHELFHGLAVGALQDSDSLHKYDVVLTCVDTDKR